MSSNNDAAIALLEKHFDIAFAAPDGIKKLRELILSLAMQGKLVSQDPSDQPASELLREIEAEKKRLVKEGKIKQSKPSPEIKSDESPYTLPNSWEWVRLNNVFDVRDGTHDTPKYVDIGYPLITSKNLYTGVLSFEDVKFISEEDYIKINERSRVDIGDILFAMIGSIGNPVIVDCSENFSIKNVALFKFYSTDKPIGRYLHYFLKQAQKSMIANSSGAVQSFVSLGFLRNYLFPLSPLAEQHRIVAKIDELMARCDELEKLRGDRDHKQITVHTAALNRLLIAKQQSEFNTAWQFITQHFSELYSVKENVAELREAILQLAVMGKLVPQHPSDQPASELLKEIEKEKERLVKEGKIKKSRPLSEIEPDEVPYNLPKGWKWVRLGYVGAFERGRSKHRPRNEQRLFSNGSYPFVQTGDVSKAKLTNNEINSCSSYYNDFGLQQSRLWSRGTLCITIAANIAETGFLGMEACIPDSIVAFISIDESLSKFVKVFIDVAKEDLEHFAPSTAQKNINLGIINDLIFPLPPLAEQHRIVAKIDQLTALCDNLEKQIDNANSKQANLLNAVTTKI